MAEYQKFRNLQLYRNGEVIPRPKDAAKEIVEGKFYSSEIELRDGEPIFVRYSEEPREYVKGLLGLAYDFNDANGRHKGIQWIDDGNVNIETEDDGYVELVYSESNGIYTISASANVVGLDEADCNSCYLKIVNLPNNVAYVQLQAQVNEYVLGDYIPIECVSYQDKFYFY